MFSQAIPHFTDDLPVSVTMEDDPKNPPSDNENGNDSDTTVKEGRSARLLQVTMATVCEEGNEQLVGADISGDIADASSKHSKEARASSTDAIAPFTGAADPSTEDGYVLQPPTAISIDRSLEMQIERDVESLSESERQEMHFDMHGNDLKGASNSTAGLDLASLYEKIQQDIDAPVSQDKIESLNLELLRLLEDPKEQQRNSNYERIRKILTSSGSDFYANSFDFRRKFLRAERNNIKKAARRTADYLALLWESFGEKVLSRPILLSDLSPTERQLQRKGHQQLFRFRDQSLHRSHASEPKQAPDKQQERLQDLDSGAGRRIAGSFDLCRCVSHTEAEIDDETTKVSIQPLDLSISNYSLYKLLD